MKFSFDSFVDGSYDFDATTKTNTGIWLREEKMDIGGGKISISDIDKLKDYPDADTVTVSGLNQETLEYFINTFGKQLKAIRFFKNKRIEDLSVLGTLPNLEYLYFFANNRITSLWNMSNNTSLTSICIEDYSGLSSISGIQTAPSLTEFRIGNAIWDKLELSSLSPLANTNIEKLSFYGRAITDNDLSFLETLPKLKVFDFSTNIFTTEQVAWMVANFPYMGGYALKAKIDCTLFESNTNLKKVPGTIIVGKRKPHLIVKGNEERIKKYVDKFEQLKTKYKAKSYEEAFLR